MRAPLEREHRNNALIRAQSFLNCEFFRFLLRHPPAWQAFKHPISLNRQHRQIIFTNHLQKGGVTTAGAPFTADHLGQIGRLPRRGDGHHITHSHGEEIQKQSNTPVPA